MFSLYHFLSILRNYLKCFIQVSNNISFLINTMMAIIVLLQSKIAHLGTIDIFGQMVLCDGELSSALKDV